VASRNSFLDNIDLPSSQRRKVERVRRESGFRGSGSGGSAIRRETAAEKEQRERQTRLRNLQKELSEKQVTLSESERQAILSGKSVSDIRQQVASRTRREALRDLQKDLSYVGAKLSEADAQKVLRGASVSSIRETAFSRAEKERLERQRTDRAKEQAVQQLRLRQIESKLKNKQSEKTQEVTENVNVRNQRNLAVISARPETKSISERVRRFSQQNDFASTGVVATGAGVIAGAAGIVEGTIQAIRNPLQAIRSAKQAGGDFFRGGNPLPDFQLQNPRSGDFAAGVIGVNVAAIAGSPAASKNLFSKITKTDVQARTTGRTQTIKQSGVNPTTGQFQTTATAQNKILNVPVGRKKRFVAQTISESAEIPSVLDNVKQRLVRTQSNIQQVTKKGRTKGDSSRAITSEVQSVTEGNNINRFVSQGASATDGKPLRTGTVGLSKKVTDDFTIGASVTRAGKTTQASAQAAKKILEGELPVVRTINGVTVEQVLPSVVREVRARSFSGRSADKLIKDLQPKDFDFVNQRKANLDNLNKGSASTVLDSSSDIGSQVNQQIISGVEDLVQQQTASKIKTVSEPTRATPSVNLPSGNQPPVITASPQTTQSTQDVVFDKPVQKVQSPRAIISTTRTRVGGEVSLDQAISSSSGTRSVSKPRREQSNPFDRDTSTLPDIDQIPKKSIIPVQKSITKASQRTRQVVTPSSVQKLSSQQSPRIPFIPPRANTALSRPKDLFRVVVGKKGNVVFRDFGVGGLELVSRAKEFVRNTPAASFSVKPVSGKGRFRLQEKDFVPSKSRKDTFVERREKRISTEGELRGITFKSLLGRQKGSTNNVRFF
jgi:hypothetical protein